MFRTETTDDHRISHPIYLVYCVSPVLDALWLGQYLIHKSPYLFHFHGFIHMPLSQIFFFFWSLIFYLYSLPLINQSSHSPLSRILYMCKSWNTSFSEQVGQSNGPRMIGITLPRNHKCKLSGILQCEKDKWWENLATWSSNLLMLFNLTYIL